MCYIVTGLQFKNDPIFCTKIYKIDLNYQVLSWVYYKYEYKILHDKVWEY